MRSSALSQQPVTAVRPERQGNSDVEDWVLRLVGVATQPARADLSVKKMKVQLLCFSEAARFYNFFSGVDSLPALATND